MNIEVEGSHKNLNSIFFHLTPAATAFAAWPLNNFPLTQFFEGWIGGGRGYLWGLGEHVFPPPPISVEDNHASKNFTLGIVSFDQFALLTF